MNINISLDRDFEVCFDQARAQYGETLARLNGMSMSQLDYTDFIDNFIDKSTVADASIDGNANVGHKDIVSLENEMNKPHSKLLAFNKIFYELKKTYGVETAREWFWAEWVGFFYMHDAYNSTYKPYCFAYDIEDLVNQGLYFIDNFNAQAAQHLVTYTDFVCEYISWNSNRTSGAVGTPSYLIYSFYYWKKDVDSGYYTKSPEYYRDQEFQRIVLAIVPIRSNSNVQTSLIAGNSQRDNQQRSFFNRRTFNDYPFMGVHSSEWKWEAS